MAMPHENPVPFPQAGGDWGPITHAVLVDEPRATPKEAAMSKVEEAFAAQLADLKPLLTPAFCETLVEAARTFGWQSEDYAVVVEFVMQCLELGDQSVLIDLSPYIQQA